MFLPTKAHTKEIIDGQYKIRIGNRVPKDAVNLAYTYVPAIHADENLLITDLSDTILENSKNQDDAHLFMYPDASLLLQVDNGEIELATEDVLITNVFKDNIPLYYAYPLTYYHYDSKGPDPYGIYEKDGIIIIDEYGKPIDRPYQIQLIPVPDHQHLYQVIVYTSFKDQASDRYRVLYNAIDIKPDGTIETKAGYREPMNLQRAFRRIKDINELVEHAKRKDNYPIYYQANGERIGTSRLFVPSPQIKDTRVYEKFRYQVALEVELEGTRYVFSSPWYSDSVLNYMDLTPTEQKTYINGFKQITEKTAEAIMYPFVPYKYFTNNEKVIRRYFVNIDNPRVTESLRVDGSSPIYVMTNAEHENNKIFIPKDAKTIKIPIEKSTKLHFHARPLYAHKNDIAYISFVIDNSESMAINDPEKVLRYKMMQTIIESARDTYVLSQINGYFFNYLPHIIRETFETADESFIDLYHENSFIDSDVTKPVPAMKKAVDYIDQHVASYSEKMINGEKEIHPHHKYIVLITDGELEDFPALEQTIEEANQKQITVAVITWKNVEILEDICKRHEAICLNATSPRIAMELRYFFFQLLGIRERIDIYPAKTFSMSPDDNDKTIFYVQKDTFTLPSYMNQEPERYAIEFRLDDSPSVPELTIYIEDSITQEILPTMSGAYVVTLDIFHRQDRSFYIKAHSEAWQYYFAQKYAVQFNDKRKIQILPPREKKNDLSWYIRIRNGRFDRQLLNKTDQPTYHYSIPEYYRQDFLEEGYPYREIKRERPDVLTNHELRLRHTPLYCKFNGEEVTNIQVLVNNKALRVKEWNAHDGIIKVDGTVTENDEIYVDYQYEEHSYIYRGYYDEENDCFWRLDLNPSKGHYITMRDPIDGVIKDVPSFTLINKVVYIYMRPASRVKKLENGTFAPAMEVQKYAIYHTFEKVNDDTSILLGEIRVRPNSSQENIQIIDTRTRGGGLKENITPEKMKEFEEESTFYWDIGHWDGQPYPENGVIVVRISKNILKEFGGQFTRSEVEDKLNKYLGYGILPIIEFVDDPDTLLQIPEDLVVEVIDVEEDIGLMRFKPTFDLKVEDHSNGETN